MKFMVAFSSPKRSAKTVGVAAQHAKALNAELVLLRVIPDPHKVGVVAELIATERPMEKAQEQVNDVSTQLREQGINASGMVTVGEVAPGIIKVAQELKVDMLFVGTTSVSKHPFFLMKKDPVVHYLVDHCPLALCLVRHEDSPDETE
ncbi:MAG: universal stress protein [Candidatus Melainabacteria bacterium]|nr:universal stress protein [Candidatus Melainabacteria bacterium]